MSRHVPNTVTRLRQVGSARVRLDGARARMERSFQSHLRLYAEELGRADPSDPDTFVALIQCAPDLRFPPGRVADLCGVSTRVVRGWVRGRDLPDPEGRTEVLSRLRAAVEERVRVAPDLSVPAQAASGSGSVGTAGVVSQARVCSTPMNQTSTR